MVAFALLGSAVKAQGADDWAGSYESAAGLRLFLERAPDGSFAGALTIASGDVYAELEVALRATGPNRLDGEFREDGERFPLTAERAALPGRIVLTSEGNVLELERTGAATAAAGARPANPLAQAGTQAPSRDPRAAPGRNVVFNGARLDAAALQRLEGPAPIIPDGEYWYDKRSGMVGYRGGPTLAYLAPDLDFCPPLSASASGGGTNVAVNGRYLHPQDLIGLQYYFGPIQPGRYWLDGQGNYGIENGPALGNLVEQILILQALAAAQAQGGGDPGFGGADAGFGGVGAGFGGADAGPGGGGEGGSVYTHFANLGAAGTGVAVADVGGGDTIVNAGGVMWWPGK